MSTRYWAEDPYWTAAYDAYVAARASGQRQLVLNLDFIDETIGREGSVAYRLMEAMESIREREGMEGCRGAPRVLTALLMKLSTLSAVAESARHLTAVLADITSLSLDAIVNAANKSLAPGGGVCGAIHAAAGPQLAAACAHAAPCPEGEARITPGFLLPAKYVIHAVGPRWNGGTHGEPARLASAYRSSFSLARAHGVRSIAFPAISAGIFGYPLQQATEIAVAEARAALARGEVERVVFACFSREVLDAYIATGIGESPTK